MIRDSKGDRIFTGFNYAYLTVCLVITLYPLIYIVASSFSDAKAVVSGQVWLYPIGLNVDAYQRIFQSQMVFRGFGNSLLYTVLGTVVNLFVTTLAAYPLSRKDFMPRGLCMGIMAFTMLFNGGLIPTYLLVRGLGMIDTIWAMVIPGALSVWNVILMRTYFQTSIPGDMLEAAQLDGCRDGRYLVSIMLPLSGPILAVLTLFFAVGHWNSYFSALIYLNKAEMMPLQIVLRDILIGNSFDPMMMQNMDMREMQRQQNMKDLLKFALIVVASAPALIVYPFVQKYFIKGVMIGALKG